ncbi:tyrosine-type recombinase/integrase [Piscirickettsia salmonis]|uniref:tyrosine-type recombinase/integrase n=1 Tax=Piscirickettsia salmonis TaxID=1238 RepID=UPI000A7DBC43
MGLNKQAKILSERQEKTVLSSLQSTTYPTRNTAMFLLSIKAGLRAKEIAALTWEMLLTPESELCEAIHLRNTASKGKQGGRVIPLNKQLKQVLSQLLDESKPKHGQRPVILSRRNSHFPAQTVVNWFAELYKNLGFEAVVAIVVAVPLLPVQLRISSKLVVPFVMFNNSRTYNTTNHSALYRR